MSSDNRDPLARGGIDGSDGSCHPPVLLQTVLNGLLLPVYDADLSVVSDQTRWIVIGQFDLSPRCGCDRRRDRAPPLASIPIPVSATARSKLLLSALALRGTSFLRSSPPPTDLLLSRHFGSETVKRASDILLI